MRETKYLGAYEIPMGKVVFYGKRNTNLFDKNYLEYILIILNHHFQSIKTNSHIFLKQRKQNKNETYKTTKRLTTLFF